jgi:hypothetical protein
MKTEIQQVWLFALNRKFHTSTGLQVTPDGSLLNLFWNFYRQDV